MINAAQLAFAFIALGLFSGCQTAAHLNDANEQLLSYYTAKSQAADPTMKETAVASLQGLATNTAERANAESDPLNKISFYRIAATAAWQAGDANVVEYAAAGSQVCEDQWDNAPRDCGMLLFIDDLAAIDETTATFNELKASNASVDEAVDVFERYEATANTMIEIRPQLATNVPVSLLVGFDKRLDELICSLIAVGANGLAVTAGATIDGACRIDNLRLKSRDAGTDLPSCSGSLPTAINPDCD